MTHSIVKDLVWVPDVLGEKSFSIVGVYQVYPLGTTELFGAACNNLTVGDKSANPDVMKAACQADYEARILEALDLPAYRREVLEDAAQVARKEFEILSATGSLAMAEQAEAIKILIRALSQENG